MLLLGRLGPRRESKLPVRQCHGPRVDFWVKSFPENIKSWFPRLAHGIPERGQVGYDTYLLHLGQEIRLATVQLGHPRHQVDTYLF